MSAEADLSTRPPRTSQREIKSCGFCYRRKLKCDQVFPCKRCVSRGLGDLCERETVIVNGRVTGGSSESRQSRRQPTLAQLLEENKTLHRRVSAQEKTIQSLLAQVEEDSPDAVGGKGVLRNALHKIGEGSGGVSSRASSVDEDKAVEDDERSKFLSSGVGQIYGLSAQGTGDKQQYQRSHLFTQASPSTLQSLRMLVPIAQSSALVRHHCTFLHWIHAVFHVPSFLQHHDAWIEELRIGGPDDVSYDYYALYFAIIACSLYFVDKQTAIEWGLTPEMIDTMPRFWFDTSLNCLQLAGFMEYPTLPILQAICILPTIAHAFDQSRYLSSLMHCGIGLARDLNFHLVQAGTSPAIWGGNVNSQIVRRIWWCLMIADSLAPSAQHPYHLVYPSAWTSPPANIEDVDLIEERRVVARPSDQVTCVSHVITMGKLADLFRDFAWAFNPKQSSASRFRVVKNFNDRLDRLFDDCQVLRPDEQEVYTGLVDSSGPFDWRPWARYVWATAIPTVRIQLWRWHLGRSYIDSRFAQARQVCVAAARAMIRVRSKPVPVMFQKNWHVSSHTVICGMVLANELLHGAPDSTARNQLQWEVQEVLALLRNMGNPNAMVQRGIGILESMLVDAETATQSASDNLDQSLGWEMPPNGFTWPLGDDLGDVQWNLFDSLMDPDAWSIPGFEGGLLE